jgi:hypothetical protein
VLQTCRSDGAYPAAEEMMYICNTPNRMGDGKGVCLCQRVQDSDRAVRANRNTLVFLTQTKVVADVEVLIVMSLLTQLLIS